MKNSEKGIDNNNKGEYNRECDMGYENKWRRIMINQTKGNIGDSVFFLRQIKKQIVLFAVGMERFHLESQ